jgi:hypothetical protein
MAGRNRKSKFTATVSVSVISKVDERAAKLKMSRSAVVEQAMEMWLQNQAEQEEERYFMAAAVEMNADAMVWNQLTRSNNV